MKIIAQPSKYNLPFIADPKQRYKMFLRSRKKLFKKRTISFIEKPKFKQKYIKNYYKDKKYKKKPHHKKLLKIKLKKKTSLKKNLHKHIYKKKIHNKLYKKKPKSSHKPNQTYHKSKKPTPITILTETIAKNKKSPRI